MRLVDLNPFFCDLEADGHLEARWQLTERTAALDFNCPGCAGKPWAHRVFAPLAGRWPDGGPMWSFNGSSFDDLTFHDSPTGTRSIRVMTRCKSHFNITSGAIDFYDDSGHKTYEPSNLPIQGETSMSNPTPTTPPCVDDVPTGYVRTAVLKFINGILHQLHCAPYAGPEPQSVYVPVPGTATPPGLLNFFEQQVAPLRAEIDALKLQVGRLMGAGATTSIDEVPPTARPPETTKSTG